MATRWISTQDAAEWLDCTRQHVAVLVKQEKLRAKRFGHVLQISESSVIDYSISDRRVGRPRFSRDKQPRKRREPKPVLVVPPKDVKPGGSRVKRSVDI